MWHADSVSGACVERSNPGSLRTRARGRISAWTASLRAAWGDLRPSNLLRDASRTSRFGTQPFQDARPALRAEPAPGLILLPGRDPHAPRSSARAGRLAGAHRPPTGAIRP